MQAEYLKNDGVLIGNNLERLSEILSDTKHRAASLRQLSFLFWGYYYIYTVEQHYSPGKRRALSAVVCATEIGYRYTSEICSQAYR